MRKIVTIMLLLFLSIGWQGFTQDETSEEPNREIDNSDSADTSNSKDTAPETASNATSDADPDNTGQSTPAESQNETQETVSSKIIPEFPEKNPDIIYIEGEEAVSTNFNWTGTRYYGTSGNTTLQLNQGDELEGDDAYYAEYVFYVETAGTYEFWYGGTPAGPETADHPSYVSPFSYKLDDGGENDVSREKINVTENYVPSYYWNKVNRITLEPGMHTIRFQVDEKRRYDGRYYFYLDSFFFAKIENEKPVLNPPLPEIFPQNMESEKLDKPFRSFEDYQIYIRNHPQEIQAFIEISLAYTLVGDYLNAIKYLKKAQLLESDNTEVILLLAKNRIWKGDMEKGLKTYNELLSLSPKRKELWLEAGKVAAWTSRYNESVNFYKRALEQFPNDLNLLVNTGITLLWKGDAEKAAEYLEQARMEAEKSQQTLKNLGQIFIDNGYPDKAVPTYQKAISQKPEDLEAYLLLEEVLKNQNRHEEANKIRERIQNTFKKTKKLEQFLSVYRTKQTLEDKILQQYREKLNKQPDNLGLRKQLAQTYFWNGNQYQAINEYINIISNQAYRAIRKLDTDMAGLNKLYDSFSTYRLIANNISKKIDPLIVDLSEALSDYETKYNAYKTHKEKLQKAEKQEDFEYSPPENKEYEKEKDNAANNLSNLLAHAKLLKEKWNNIFENFERTKEHLVDEILNRYTESQTSFQNLMEKTNWRWDKKQFYNELKSATASVLPLSRYVRARTRQIENEYNSAQTIIDEIKEQNSISSEGIYTILHQQIIQGDLSEVYSLLYGLENRELPPNAIEEEDKEDEESNSNRIQSIIDKSPELSQISSYSEHLPEIKRKVYQFYQGDIKKPVDLKEDFEQQTQSVIDELDSLENSIPNFLKEINKQNKTIATHMQKELIQTIYSFQEETANLRNELGQFYLAQEDLQKAIAQINQVIAIDPSNVEALYRLASIYEWGNEWSKAMTTYRKVYDLDPAHENTTKLYNALARKHALTIDAGASFTADPSNANYNGYTSFNKEINNNLSLNGGLNSEHIRQNRSISKNGLYYKGRASYQLHTAYLQMPLSVSSLKITPEAGVRLLGNELYLTSDAESSDSDIDPTETENAIDNFRTFSPDAYGSVQVSFPFPFFPYISTLGKYTFEQHKETYLPALPAAYTHTAEANLYVSYSFLPVPVLKNIFMRNYAQAKILTDNNVILTGVEELSLPVYRSDLFSSLSIALNATYQHTLEKTEVQYFTPVHNLVTKGGVFTQMNLPSPENHSINLNWNILGGVHQERLLEKEHPVTILGEGSVTFNYEMERVKLSVGGNGSINYKVLPEDSQDWGYWTFTLSTGVSISSPQLIAP